MSSSAGSAPADASAEPGRLIDVLPSWAVIIAKPVEFAELPNESSRHTPPKIALTPGLPVGRQVLRAEGWGEGLQQPGRPQTMISPWAETSYGVSGIRSSAERVTAADRVFAQIGSARGTSLDGSAGRWEPLEDFLPLLADSSLDGLRTRM